MGRGRAPRGRRASARRGRSTARTVVRSTGRDAAARCAVLRACAIADPQAERDVLVFPVREPESIGRDVKLLRRVVRDGTPTIILCDNTGQAERLEELLNEGEWSPSPAAITIGVLNGGFILPPGLRSAESRVTSHESPGFGDEPRVAGQDSRGLRVLTDHEIFRRDRRLRRTRRYGIGRRARNRHRTQARRLRRAPRARRRHLSRHRDDLRPREHDRSRRDRIRGRRPAQRAAVPPRPGRAISRRAARPATTRRLRGCTSWAAAGGSSSAIARSPPSTR